MDPVQIIKQQEIISKNISQIYNDLSSLSQIDVARDEFRGRLESLGKYFQELKADFDSNDRELSEPSHTMKKNAYYTGTFVSEVRKNMERVESLYDYLSTKVEKEDKMLQVVSDSFKAAAPPALEDININKVQGVNENIEKGGVVSGISRTKDQPKMPLPNLSSFSKSRGLVRKFQYVLDELETKIEKLKLNEVSAEIVKEKYKTAEGVFLEYMEEFPDDYLTECFYLLRDRYVEIPNIENLKKSLPFTLPPIDIPRFNGKLAEWETFKELFEQLIIAQPIPNTQKMCILKSKVSGEAARKISKLPARDENFEVAWKILTESYSNKRATTSLYFKSLLDVPCVSYSNNSVKQFVETVNECLQALGAMKIEGEELYQAFLCFVLQRKLDDHLRIQFEQHLGNSRELPKIDQMMEFLTQMQYSLEASQQFTGEKDLKLVNPSGNQKSWEAGRMSVNPSRQFTKNVPRSHKYEEVVSKTKSTPRIKCPLGCSMDHALFRCSKFRSLPTKEKWEKVIEHNICSKCLNAGHTKKVCTSNFICKNCNGDHHILLHKEKINQKSAVVSDIEEKNNYVLLSTAVVQVNNEKGEWVDCRILLDSGSQVCLMTQKFKNKLKLSGQKTNREIEGLSQKKCAIQEKVGINLRSRTTQYNTYLEALILPNIVSNVPERKVVAQKIPHYVQLADPEYYIPKGIDMLIGAGIFFEIMSEGQIKDENKGLILQNTKLGWIAGGSAIIENSKEIAEIVTTVQDTCDEVMQKFWEIEEVPRICKLTAHEKECEEIFNKNIIIATDGKFQVKLPFKIDPKVLGVSNTIAKRRLFSLERKLDKDPQIKVQYHDFLKQYLEMGHMEIMTDYSVIKNGYYLPHHCVLKPESTSTKLRVVFDASCKTTTNVSLNEVLHTGPRIQEDLFNILLRFRKHRYVFSADVEKMYRQIWVTEADRKYQLILWRWNPTESIKTYALKTVTYGTSSAPYLAVKCLQKIADIQESEFPAESEVIRNDFYMDDLMTGGDCLESVKTLLKNVNNIMDKYRMPLRKWCSNEKQLLDLVNENHIALNLKIESGQSSDTKALGVVWNPKADDFGFKCEWEAPKIISKRTILGEVSKLFDPLGLVGPVIVTAKIFLQELWRLKVSWDDKIPEEIITKWKSIRDSFRFLSNIRITRHLLCENPIKIELHGFSDASMKAYGAAVYIKSTDKSGNIVSRLAASKSRVAPIKTITLPRLELCASVLLIELIKAVETSLKIKPANIYYYTDSTIVLNWIKIDPGKLQIFVSNRVSFIQANSQTLDWRYVKSAENSADLISRGIAANELVGNSFWFEGPQFLKDTIDTNPSFEVISEIPEIKNCYKGLVVQERQSLLESINHKNSFKFLQNVMTYVFKFISQTRKQGRKSFLNYKKEALRYIIKDIQKKHFGNEIDILKAKKCLSKSSNISSLCPIIDTYDVLRVGGRLEHSSLTYDAKHPVLLPYKDRIVELLVEYLHVQHLHIGAQGLLAIVRQQFWPLRGRQLVKKVVSKCYRCFKVMPRHLHQLMGDLPEDRVLRTRPFLTVGIDFLGPIKIHHKVRGKKEDKAYVCVFVCFATKAAHLEVVSDLSSAAFIGALKRFVGRRGCPLRIYSDNGTNFVGAANSLHFIFQMFSEKQHKKGLDNFCNIRNIEWRNIPARSPHVGGLWEACVKSVKKHFYKVSEGVMTFEELYTLMTQIEAVLNSRPLTPLSDDPNDLQVLTPAHLLIGEAMTTFMDTSSNKCYQGIRDHWKAVQNNNEEFWKRWSVEYLSELQKRFKWNKPQTNIVPGTLVLLKDNDTPPMSWRRGRVIRTIMGSDGLCRMVDVRTSTGETKRSIHNVCPFPTTDEELERSDNSTFKENTDTPLLKNESKVALSTLQISNNKDNKCYKVKSKNIISFLITFLAIISPARAQYDIIKFKDSSGIFYEKVAMVGLTKTSWDIVIHINISDYLAAKGNLHEAMEKMKHIRIRSGLTNVVQALQERYNIIENQHQIIMATTGRSKRTKRSFLPFMGGILHHLFGLMDEEHAESLAAQINSNTVNNEYLLSALKNQSSVQDVTRDIINKQNNEIFKDIMAISNTITSMEQNVEEVQKLEVLTIRMNDVSNRLESFAEIQRSIIAAVFNTRGSFLSTLLPLEKFRRQMEIMKEGMNPKLKLPSEDPVELAKISSISVGRTTEFIIFNIRVPLRNAEMFNAYAIYSYPIIHDGLFLQIRPSSRYMLIDEKKSVFYGLNDDNFNHCQRVDDILLCPQVHPLYKTYDSKICEVLCFMRRKRIPESCEIAVSKVHSYWQQTQSPNTWIFSSNESTPANVKCSGKMTNIIIEGTGILKLQPDCLIETAELNLWAYDAYQADVEYTFPNFNLSTFIPDLKHLQLKADIEVYKIPDIPKSNSILGFPTPLNIHHVAHYGISFTMVIIIFIVIIAVTWLFKGFCRISSNYLPSTIAAPRLV